MDSTAKLSITLPMLFAAVILPSGPTRAQQSPVTAIDILLVPDRTLIRQANDANARLRKVFPKGFALDATTFELPIS